MKTHRLIQTVLAAVVLSAGTTSCCVADWYHDLVYGDKPLPTDPIAPAGHSTGAERIYTGTEIAALATDSLIFYFTANGIHKPCVAAYVSPEKSLESVNLASLGSLIFSNLLKNKVITTTGKPQYLLQLSNAGTDICRITLRKYVDEKNLNGEVLLTEQYKIKGTK